MKLRINIFFILIFFVSIVSNSTEIEEITIFEKKIQSLSLFSNNKTIKKFELDNILKLDQSKSDKREFNLSFVTA